MLTIIEHAVLLGFNITSKLVVALIFTLSYYSLYLILTPFTSFILTLPAFLISYIITEVFYRTGRKHYKPYFINRAKRYLNDILLKENVGFSKNNENRYLNKSFYLEFNLLLVSFSILIFILTTSFHGITAISTVDVLSELRFQHIFNATLIYLLYIACSLIFIKLYNLINLTIKSFTVGRLLLLYIYLMLFLPATYYLFKMYISTVLSLM